MLTVLLLFTTLTPLLRILPLIGQSHFKHPQFRRDHPDEWKKIKRRLPEGGGGAGGGTAGGNVPVTQLKEVYGDDRKEGADVFSNEISLLTISYYYSTPLSPPIPSTLYYSQQLLLHRQPVSLTIESV